MSALAHGSRPPGTEPSEQELVAAVRSGDDRAFEELYARYGRRIVSYVFGMVGDHGRAEDIAQEVFISALRRMRATERPIAFKPWIYEIAKNACIDEFRRTRRAQEVPLEADDDTEIPARQPVASGQTPHASYERRQQLNDLTGAFRGLSDNHHKVLVLRELEGLSYSEIGRRMGMTRPVVESTLFRARRRLGQEYEEIASGQRCEQVCAVIDSGGAGAIRALGIRERRRLTRHVSHCQPCRRHAWLAGVEESVLRPPSLAEKVAALLPIPAFLRWRRGGSEDETSTVSGSHSVASLQSLQTAAQLAGPGSPAPVLGRAAAAVAALAIAGGGVVAVSSHGASKPARPKIGATVGGAPPSRRSAVAKVARVHAVRGARSSAVPGRASAARGSTAAPAQSASGVAHTAGAQTQTAGSGGTSGLPLTLTTAKQPPSPSLPHLPKVNVPQPPGGLPQVNVPALNNVLNQVPDPVQTVQKTLSGLRQQLGGGL